MAHVTAGLFDSEILCKNGRLDDQVDCPKVYSNYCIVSHDNQTPFYLEHQQLRTLMSTNQHVEDFTPKPRLEF